MKICAISDLHGHLPEIEPCDLLLVAGDVTPIWDHSLFTQASWLDGPFRQWLHDVPAKRIIGIAGNHDFIFEHPERVPKNLPWTYLQDSGCIVDLRVVCLDVSGRHDQIRGRRHKIWGTPWSKQFNDWAFMLPESELVKKWELIPKDTDILIVHGPPYGFGDRTIDGIREGSISLATKAIEIPLVVFGHIHEGRGNWISLDGTSMMANVSLINEHYKPVHQPMYFDFDLPGVRKLS